MNSKRPLNSALPEVELRGVDKVTALLLSMGKEQADRIIKHFDHSEIRLVARAASALPTVGPEVLDRLADDLLTQIGGPTVLVGSVKEAEQLITGVVSEEHVSEIISEIEGTSADRVWPKLNSVDDEKIAAFLQSEEPQVAALVLRKLNPEKASSVLAILSSELRAEVSMRLLSRRPVSAVATRIIAERLGLELLGAAEVTSEPSVHARLGFLLNKLERDQIADILRGIERKDPESAKLVEAHVFSFEDVAGLTLEDRARLFDQIQSDRVVTALRGAEPTVRDAVLSALSPRSRRIVEAELATEVKLSRKAIVDVRRAIAGLALGMAERSEIMLRPDASSIHRS